MRRLRLGLAVAMACPSPGLLACSSEGEPRAQLLIVVDTDAPVVGQLPDSPTLSGDAAIDSLRVDFLGDQGTAYASQTFVAPEALDWPISFGVVTPEGEAGKPALIRLRAFRGLLAEVEQIGEDTEPRPRPEAAIDRLVEIPLPGDGVEGHRVTLSLQCFGNGAGFLPLSTCIDGSRPSADPSEGLEAQGAAGMTRAGTAELAHAVECSAAPSGDRICIPGGFTLLGDLHIVGVADILFADAVPLRPVYLSPFWLDRAEVTVARYRGIHDQVQGTPPALADPGDPWLTDCTFRGANDSSNDAMPLNCVARDTAQEICQLLGGELPTEAQWEHAAAGRGQGRRFSWGDEPASCCVASLARGTQCPGEGPEPGGSHPPESCNGTGDVSRDGVVDLGGSLAELQRDSFRPYDDDQCWAPGGIAFDPHCQVATSSTFTVRGGNYQSGLGTALAALRLKYTQPSVNHTYGVRCAYGDEP
jgi:formylglycine-generating enzyme required for sulfatase activity